MEALNRVGGRLRGGSRYKGLIANRQYFAGGRMRTYFGPGQVWPYGNETRPGLWNGLGDWSLCEKIEASDEPRSLPTSWPERGELLRLEPRIVIVWAMPHCLYHFRAWEFANALIDDGVSAAINRNETLANYELAYDAIVESLELKEGDILMKWGPSQWWETSDTEPSYSFGRWTNVPSMMAHELDGSPQIVPPCPFFPYMPLGDPGEDLLCPYHVEGHTLGAALYSPTGSADVQVGPESHQINFAWPAIDWGVLAKAVSRFASFSWTFHVPISEADPVHWMAQDMVADHPEIDLRYVLHPWITAVDGSPIDLAGASGYYTGPSEWPEWHPFEVGAR